VIWFTEKLHTDWQLQLLVGKILFEKKSEHQHLVIFEHASLGRVLILDDIIQTTEADEFMYHEMLAHVPILAHGNVRSVLIVGGGDGGVLKQVLKHGVERVTQVELDQSVIALCCEYLPAVCGNAFDDPRLDLVIADGAKFVAETEQAFDVIIVDSTDPLGPGEVLFSAEFYAGCKRCLAPGGILVSQNGCPFLQTDEMVDSYRRLRPLFTDVTFFVAPIPTYIGGFMTFGWATMDETARQQPREAIESRYAEAGIESRYYNPDIHVACFALPNYIRELMS
jgi:spermidine synthase